MSAAAVCEEWRFQAVRDLDVAKHLASGGYYEWSAYASQQAAEKAIKAVRHALAIDLHDKDKKQFTHNLIELAKPVRELSQALLPVEGVLGALMFHEADARYPGVGRGPPYRAPARVYDLVMAYNAALAAEAIVTRCERLVRDVQTFWNAQG
jgi:HEPN domain-containing protein